MGMLWANTHTPHLPQHLQITHNLTHVTALHRPFPLLSHWRHSSSPQWGTISRPALHAHLPPCSLSTSSFSVLHPCHHAAWLWEAQKLDSFKPWTEGLWWGRAREMKPWPELKRPIPSQLSQGGLPENSRDPCKTEGDQLMFFQNMWSCMLTFLANTWGHKGFLPQNWFTELNGWQISQNIRVFGPS